MTYCLKNLKKKWGNMHKHIYSAGAIRGNVTYRYCDCGEMILSNSRVTRSNRNDDIAFYKLMAERYKV